MHGISSLLLLGAASLAIVPVYVAASLCFTNSSTRICDPHGVFNEIEKNDLAELIDGEPEGARVPCPCRDECARPYPIGLILLGKGYLPIAQRSTDDRGDGENDKSSDLDYATADMRTLWWESRNCTDYITLVVRKEPVPMIKSYMGKQATDRIGPPCVIHIQRKALQTMLTEGTFNGTKAALTWYRRARTLTESEQNLCQEYDGIDFAAHKDEGSVAENVYVFVGLFILLCVIVITALICTRRKQICRKRSKSSTQEMNHVEGHTSLGLVKEP